MKIRITLKEYFSNGGLFENIPIQQIRVGRKKIIGIGKDSLDGRLLINLTFENGKSELHFTDDVNLFFDFELPEIFTKPKQ